jgi:hypothetical protein
VRPGRQSVRTCLQGSRFEYAEKSGLGVEKGRPELGNEGSAHSGGDNACRLISLDFASTIAGERERRFTEERGWGARFLAAS